MDREAKAALWIVALGVITAGLYFGRGWLTQFAMAIILWFAIEGLRLFLAARAPAMPRWLSFVAAFALVLTLMSFVGYMVMRNVTEIAGRLAQQGPRLNAFVAQIYHALGVRATPPTIDALLAHADPGALLSTVGAGLQSVVGNLIFILIYLGFLFTAATRVPEKLDRIFPEPNRREEVRLVLTEIQQSMGKYLWVQTVMSIVATALTLATLLALGMPNAAFWAFLIFFLNYIPTVGSIIAVVLVTLAAVVESDSLTHIALIAGGVTLWQFVIGNFVQPRLTGNSLNLSAVVVLLALALWGSLWGMVGAFLSAPLTTMIMLVCAQEPSTRWLAILLSEDGRPKILTRASQEA